MHPPYPCRDSELEGTLPSQMIAAARSQVIEGAGSHAARIIPTTMPDGPAFPAFV